MIHAFMLVVVMGTGEFRQTLPNPMYFYDIDRCQYFASKTVKQHGNYTHSYLVDAKDRITAYCKPVYIDSKTPTLYE